MEGPRESVFAAIRESCGGVANGEHRPGCLSIPDAAEFPCLTALLDRIPAGSPKGTRPGAVTLFIQDGRLTACVTCPALGRRAFVALDAMSDVLCVLEKCVQENILEWRPEKRDGRK